MGLEQARKRARGAVIEVNAATPKRTPLRSGERRPDRCQREGQSGGWGPREAGVHALA
jgi:hypothetical protein